jgi:hypothetical protein
MVVDCVGGTFWEMPIVGVRGGLVNIRRILVGSRSIRTALGIRKGPFAFGWWPITIGGDRRSRHGLRAGSKCGNPR